MPNVFLKAISADYDIDLAAQDENTVLLRYDFVNKQLFPEVDITFQNITFRALEELWSIRPFVGNMEDKSDDFYDAVQAQYGSVKVQISVDNGDNWLFWDGLAWVPGAQFSTFRELNENLNLIPFGVYRQLRLKVKLLKGDSNTQGPRITGIRIGYSLFNYEHSEDVHRTFVDFFRERLKIKFRTVFVSNGSNSFDLQQHVSATEIVSAYNVTQDPARTLNIYDGNLNDNILGFNPAPNVNDYIEIDWVGTIPVSLFYEDRDLNSDDKKHVPKLELQVVQGSINSKARLSQTIGDYTINYATKKYWNEHPPLTMDYRIIPHALAADESLALKIADAAYKITYEFFRSEQLFAIMSGSDIEADFFTPSFSNMTDTSENLNIKSFTFIIYMREWIGKVDFGPLAQELIIELEE